MKRILYAFALLAGLLSSVQPTCAMSRARNNKKDKTELAELKQYINLKKLFLNLGNLAIDDEEDSYSADDDNEDDDRTVDPKEVIKAIIETIKIGEFPITVKVTHNGNPREVKKKIKDLFHPKKLKDFLIKVASHYAHGKIGQEHYYKYIKLLRKSLREDELQKVLGGEDFIALDGALLAAENYYKNNDRAGNIEDFINLERIPGFLGDILREYFHLDFLSVALNTALRREEVEQSMILACLNFSPLLKNIGCEEARLQTLERGLRGLASVLITWAQSEKEGIDKLFTYLGHGYEYDVFGSRINRR